MAHTFTRADRRIGGLTRSARTDMAAMGRIGQSTFRASFSDGHRCALCPETLIPAELPRHERERRADALFAAHFARLGSRKKHP